MKKITRWYLKWYYGYKNFGDELLMLWVINYLFEHYPLEILYIEVWDKERCQSRLEKHISFLWDRLCNVRLISKHDIVSVIRYSIIDPWVHKFLWWWEVFAPARGWFHGWWNMYILYFFSFWIKNVTLLGWISKAHTRPFRLLYQLTLPFCHNIILRENISYEYVTTHYRSKNKTILYHDFAYDIIQHPALSILTEEQLASKTWLLCPYILVNTNPYVDMSTLTKKLSTLTKNVSNSLFVYFSADEEDKPFFNYISVNIWHNKLTMFDWTKYDLLTTMSVYFYCQMGVWVRLHFLAVLYRLDKECQFVTYQEKVDKFFAHHKSL